MKEEHAEKIKDCIVPGWFFVSNYHKHHLGRIWVSWDPTVFNVSVVADNEQVITCDVVTVQGNMSWIQSFVYGSTKGLIRRQLYMVAFES